MNTNIHFYYRYTDKSFSLPAYITDLTDGFGANFDKVTTPMGFEKQLLKERNRNISVNLDVLANNITEGKENFYYLSYLQRILQGRIDPATSNPPAEDRTDPYYLKVLYQNIIIHPDKSPQEGVVNAGLPCQLTKVNIKMQLDSGFFVDEQYIYPKLVKLELLLTPNPFITNNIKNKPYFVWGGQGVNIVEPSNNHSPWAAKDVSQYKWYKKMNPAQPANPTPAATVPTASPASPAPAAPAPAPAEQRPVNERQAREQNNNKKAAGAGNAPTAPASGTTSSDAGTPPQQTAPAKDSGTEEEDVGTRPTNPL